MVARLSRLVEIQTQITPIATMTSPPRGRDPLATTTPEPAISAAAASGAVGRVRLTDGIIALRVVSLVAGHPSSTVSSRS